ncbi:MAG TPA: hypothetical protein VFE46_14090 [Pirellulales bacterium]|jgi:hypothetical protein|nr:hypothetical protein [Pirellulales bacterium]
MPEWTRETIVDEARKTAGKVDGPLSKSAFRQHTGISDYYIYRLFPEGGWTEIRELAGLPRHPQDNESLEDDELLQEFHRVVEHFGEVPTGHRFASVATISFDTLKKRFDGRDGLIGRYRDWLITKHPDSPLLQMIKVKSTHEIVPPPIAVPTTERPQWSKADGLVFGAPINFRGLRHAPINEQGVVYLFGMVSSELGLIVEAVQSAFPDCEAKRCIDRNNNRWQRVRIEFEFYSSNFREHGHNCTGCDLIVCWEHDWHDCPIEVIELRSVIDQLDA